METTKTFNFLLDFEEKVTLALSKSSNDWTSIYTESLSKQSLQSISNFSIGEKLSDEMLVAVGQEVREQLFKILEEAVKHARQSRSPLVQIKHVQHGMQVQGISSDLWQMVYKWPVAENEEEPENYSLVPSPTNESVKNESTEVAETLESTAPMEPKKLLPRGSLNTWVKREKVLLMANQKYPLSKEQQTFYVLITESVMGTSEALRREALRSVSTDSSLQPMLSKLCLFISDGVKVNVLQCNVSLIFYLMRLIRSLLDNPNIRLNNYFHLLIPSIITCVISRQISKRPTAQNHWGVREFASNIAADIVKNYDNRQNNVFLRIINLYKMGLSSSSLTTLYGSLVGLQKLGKFPIYEWVMPQIAAISDRIEPYLKAGVRADELEKQAAILIRYRILKMCTPILRVLRNSPDEPEEYLQTYHFLGGALCSAVIIERIAWNAKQQINDNETCTCKCNK